MKKDPMKDKDRHRYDDILSLPHHISVSHPPMPARNRAAQFAPFAALTGHGEAVKEAARLTEKKAELDEDCREALDRKLCILRERIEEKPLIRITRFVKDPKKEGGAYETITGNIRKIDGYARAIYLTDGREIRMEDISEIEEP